MVVNRKALIIEDDMKAYIFPGQGIQKKGMGGALFDEFSDLTERVDRVLGYSIKSLCLHDPYNQLNKTKYTQPAIYVVNAFHYLKCIRDGTTPASYFAGHSLGEYNALFAAGAFDFLTGLEIVKKRAELMASSDGGAMAVVVGFGEEKVVDILKHANTKTVEVANYNAPDQYVLSGDKDEINKIAQVFENIDTEAAFIVLKTSGAFHSTHMQGPARKFEEFLSEFEFSELSFPVVSNVTGGLYASGVTKNLMAQQMSSPVKWQSCIECLLELGVETFEEVGDSIILTKMIEKIKDNRLEKKTRSISMPIANVSLQDIRSNMYLCVSDRLRRDDNDRYVIEYPFSDVCRKISGSALLDKVDLMGGALSALVEEQQPIIIALPQELSFAVVLLGCWAANIVPIPMRFNDAMSFSEKVEDIHSVMLASGALHIVTTDEGCSALGNSKIANDFNILSYEYILSHSNPSAPLRRARGDDLALILYTSGSTSSPKGCALNHNSLVSCATSELWGISSKSCMVSWLPNFHAFGIYLGLIVPLVNGARTILYSPEEFISNPSSWFNLIHKYRATHTGAPGFSFDHCVNFVSDTEIEGVDLSSLISLVCGGEIISISSYEKFHNKFRQYGLGSNVLTPNYGMSEAAPITLKPIGDPVVILNLDSEALEKGLVRRAAADIDGCRTVVSCGIKDPGSVVKVVNPDTSIECSPDVVGELWVKSPFQAVGYFRDAKSTKSTFDGRLISDSTRGYLRTGDLGFIDEGNVYLVGRIKDLIVINGKNHHPVDIELTVMKVMSVARCAVFQVPGNGSDHVVVVVGISPSIRIDFPFAYKRIVAEISNRHHLEIFEVVFVGEDDIPVTGSKKVKRNSCKTFYESGDLVPLWRSGSSFIQGNMSSAGVRGLIDRLKSRILIPELGDKAECIGDDENFSDIGIDSIKMIRIAGRIESEFGVKFKVGAIRRYGSCLKIANYILSDSEENLVNAGSGRDMYSEYMDGRVIKIIKRCAEGELDIRSAINLIEEGAQ